jgi:anti-sigma regulatory factor (Ser/Thr protein kinase)
VIRIAPSAGTVDDVSPTVDLRSGQALSYKFSPRSTASVWLARELTGQWLREHDVLGSDADDLLLVCSELTTNAVAHAGRGSTIKLRVSFATDTVTIEVEDEPAGGAAASPDFDGESDEALPVGNLRVAAALSDEVTITVRGNRTTVCATKRVRH